MVCSAAVQHKVKLNPAATSWRLCFLGSLILQTESLDVEVCYPIRQIWKLLQEGIGNASQ